jgi:hypothetical protein
MISSQSSVLSFQWSYIKKLEDVDLRVLKETVAEAYFLARDQSS